MDKRDKFLADGAIYTIMGDTPISAPHTKQVFRGMVTQMRDSIDGDFIFTYGEVTAEDDRVCVEAKSFMTTRTGKDYQNEYHIPFKIRGGKVLSIKEYSDTKHVMDTFF